MSVLADVQAYNLEFQHGAQHTEHAEGAQIIFEKLTSATNAIEDIFVVTTFSYDSRSAEGRALPDGVLFELRIAESLITLDDFRGVSSIRHTTPHGTTRYSIIQPSPYMPAGMDRFWRFWLAPAEDTQ